LADGGTASGIGDILIRAKYQFYSAARADLAVAVDVRAPTGDVDNLLGTGTTQTKILFVGSGAAGTLAPHVNVGYTISGTSSNPFYNITDEFNYAVGTEYTPAPRVTFAADLLGRSLIDSGQLVETPKTFTFTTAPPASVPGAQTFSEFALQDGSTHLAFVAIGGKYNAAQNLLISGSVLFPLKDSGIRSRPVPVIGFDYTY
jgi:hypothetical protein